MRTYCSQLEDRIEYEYGPQYKLKSVIFHIGQAVLKGHYVCLSRVLINDAFCQQPATSVLSSTCAKIVCFHMPDVAQGGMDVGDVNEGQGQAEQGQLQKEARTVRYSNMICANEVAGGEYVRLIDAPKGRFFDVSANPQYEARGFLWGVAEKLIQQTKSACCFAVRTGVQAQQKPTTTHFSVGTKKQHAQTGGTLHSSLPNTFLATGAVGRDLFVVTVRARVDPTAPVKNYIPMRAAIGRKPPHRELHLLVVDINAQRASSTFHATLQPESRTVHRVTHLDVAYSKNCMYVAQIALNFHTPVQD